jgi:cell wall-associated NlpC family hydrolase
MANAAVDRKEFVKRVLAEVDAPYVIGGLGFTLWTPRGHIVHDFVDANGLPQRVFDCKGIFTTILHEMGGPDWRVTRNAHLLATECPKVQPLEVVSGRIKPGTGVAYGTQDEAGLIHIDHVMMAVGDGRVFGACGGGFDTKTPAIAKEHGACVRYRPRADYKRGRSTLRWYFHLPLHD